ncbi:MAG: hypothetical protein IJP68_03850, partial [Selenomonadaceae bacterium]|nr:hypothetical protein [Selenomonadaceae bacterium]
GNEKTITVAYDDGGALFNYVDGANISKLTVAGTIKTSNYSTAGLIGYSYGNTTIDNCTSSVTINSTYNGGSANGGFVSAVMGGKLTIKDSTFDGSFIGQNTYGWSGFVGTNLAKTEITGSLFAPAQIDVNTKDSATFANLSNNVTDSYCTKTLGTLQGEKIFTELNTPEGITATYTGGDDYKIVIGDKTYYKPGATFTLTATDGYGSNFSGYTFKAGNTSATRTSEGVYNLVLGDSDKVEFVGFPKIGSLGFDKDTNTYLINSEDDLIAFRDYVNDFHDCQGYTFKLTKDLDLKEFDNFKPIGNGSIWFKGTFDGDGHTISNLTITGYNKVGLFGYVDGGTIKDLTLTNANVSGRFYVGALTGYNYGTIENCAVEGSVSGTYYIGGLVGQNNDGTVKNSFSATKISGDRYVGALIGNNRGTAGNNGYISNVGDWTGASKYYSLELPAGVTAKYVSGGNFKTVGSNTYYRPSATFTLTLDKTNANLLANYAKVSGFKNATLISGNTYS